MWQDYLLGTDSISASQLITLIGGAMAISTYLKPASMAKYWGLDTTNEVIMWLVRQTGLVNCQMTLACALLFFLNVDPLDAIMAVFVTWIVSSLHMALFVNAPGKASTEQNHMHKRGQWTNFMFSTFTCISYYLNMPWIEALLRVSLSYAVINSFIFLFAPRVALLLWGLSDDIHGDNISLLHIHGGSHMQISTFALYLLRGIEPHKALGMAMTFQLFQIFLSAYVFRDYQKLHLKKGGYNFWALLYVPLIAALLWF
jgi:hypothetical protein